MSAVLEAALAYAARGWPVLPVDGKRPALKDWPTTATTDPDLIHAWWVGRPGANVGVVTGPRSGLAVLDVDPRSGGTDSLAALEHRVGVLPGTVQSLTGGGGLHLLYAHPGRKVTSGAHRLGRGLDVKGEGGMIVVPPSVHPGAGRAYAWLGGLWAESLPVWPDALDHTAEKERPVRRPAALAPAPRTDPGRRLAGLVQTVMDAAEGERNGLLFWAACRGAEMVTSGLSRDVVGDALLIAAQVVGLPSAEAHATVRSGLLRGPVAA